MRVVGLVRDQIVAAALAVGSFHTSSVALGELRINGAVRCGVLEADRTFRRGVGAARIFVMKTETVIYKDGELELEGYAAWDDSIAGERPAVLISHAWGGPGEFEQNKAEELAKLGYVGFALDVYGKGNRGDNPEVNAKLMTPFLEDRALLERRMQLALGAVRELAPVDRERVGAIGFCFGGLCVLDLARSGADVRGVVSFHGLLGGRDGMDKNDITAKVMVLHGHDDGFVPPEQFDAFCREMTETAADWQLHQYGHTMHAFTNPNADDPDFGTVYEPKADKRSWQSMKNFFEEAFA